MVPNNLKTYSAKFNKRVAFNQKVTELFNLLMNKPEVVEFDLRMAFSAYNDQLKTNNLVYAPNPSIYMDATAAQLSKFFVALNSPIFFEELRQLTTKYTDGPTSMPLLKKLSHGIKLNLFIDLLHFTLSTSPGNLSESSMPWYTSLKEQNEVRVFHISHDSEVEQQFHTKPGDAEFLFHGTDESCVYSILRNGMQPGIGGLVWMAKNIALSLCYSHSQHKVFFCYEVKDRTTQMMLDSLGYGGFSPSSVLLRAVLWFASAEILVISTVAMNVMNDLQNQKKNENIT